MKTISIVIACYNEEENVVKIKDAIVCIFQNQLFRYNYQILFMDNDSTDSTRMKIEQMCEEDPQHIAAIFNVHNFGSIRSSVYGILQASGDCVVKMCADFQDPPELLVNFVNEWESGYKIVLGIKRGSEENRAVYMIRKLYYKIIRSITDINHIDNFVGYGLYDRRFVEIIRELRDPMPYLRGIVAELGYKFKPVYYIQPKRRFGNSKFNFIKLYDYAMLGITSYSKVPLRIATFFGSVVAVLSALVGFIYLFYKLIHWSTFVGGIIPMLLGVFFLGSVQLISIGLIGEYILNINIRIINRPLIVEEKRINLPNKKNENGDVAFHEAINNASFSADKKPDGQA